jgi:hypothetical protein
MGFLKLFLEFCKEKKNNQKEKTKNKKQKTKKQKKNKPPKKTQKTNFCVQYDLFQ